MTGSPTVLLSPPPCSTFVLTKKSLPGEIKTVVRPRKYAVVMFGAAPTCDLPTCHLPVASTVLVAVLFSA